MQHSPPFEKLFSAFHLPAPSFVLTLCLLLLPLFQAGARQAEPPKSFGMPSSSVAVPTVALPAIDTAQLRSTTIKSTKGRKPLQVALPLALDVNMSGHGSWENIDGGSLWRVKISVPGATDLSIRLNRLTLPEGGTVHVIGSTGRYFEGPYQKTDMASHGELMIPAVPGDRITLEVFVPGDKALADLSLDRVLAGYRDLFGRQGGPFLSKSGSCNNNVICPVANTWRDEIRSTAMYIMDNGDICTGNLVAAADGSTTPYFLTANHCFDNNPNPANTVVFWNYESPVCETPGGGLLSENQIGMVLRASQVIPDVRLMELTQAPDATFNVFYAGWDRSGTAAPSSASIHHPNANDKAISFNTNAVTSGPDCSIGGTTPDTHWVVDDWEDGTTEGGSSGAALFNGANNGIVGVLSGGAAACGNQESDCYGKISEVWDGASASERLRDWLDPTNTGAMVADGFNAAPAIEYFAHTGADTCQSDTASNNGFWEPGETVDVTVQIVGNQNFTGVNATLTTQDAGVEIVTPTVTYPNLATGVARNSNTPFQIRLAEASGPACFSDLSFSVSVSSNEANPFEFGFTNPVGQSRSPVVPWGVPDAEPAGTPNTLMVEENITITDLNVRVAMDHQAVGDLIVTLTSPAGTQAVLLDRPGLPLVDPTFGCEDQDFDIVFDDSGTANLETLCNGTQPWFTGTAPPVSPLSVFNGESTQGTWVLRVSDAQFELTGEITDWELITTPVLPAVCNSCAAAEVPPGVVGVVDDVNGNGIPETLGLQVDAAGNITARAGDASTGAVLSTTAFLSDQWDPLGGFGVPPLTGQNVSGAAVVAAQKSTGLPIIQMKRVDNGALIRNLFPWSSAWELVDWGVVPGQAPGGGPSIGTLASRKSDGLMGIELKNPDNDNRIRLIYPLGLGWTAIAGEIVAIPGGWGVAALAVRDADGLTIVQVRNAADGSLIRNVFPLGFGWSPTGEIKRIPDLNGNNADEIATRMTRDSDGLEIIQIRDSMTNDLVSNVYPIGAGGGGWTTRQFEVVDINGVTHLGILSSQDTTGQILVQTKNALTATINRNVFFIGPPYRYNDYVAIPDFNGNNGSELAVYVENTSTGLRLIQVRDATDGSLIRNIFQ